MRLIDADALERMGYVLTRTYQQDKETMVYETKNLSDVPSAQPETAKRIVGKSRDGMTLWYQCEICNEPIDEQDTFCRGCGRRLVNG